MKHKGLIYGVHSDRTQFNLNNFFFFFIYLFTQKHIYKGHINKMKKSKTKIHITVIRCKATITPEIKLKEEQLQN